MIRTIWNDPERFKKSYFPPELKGYYLAGDGAQRDSDDYFWIMGRIDDVLNVSGHRLGTMERSEEHTSELQSLMRISYAVFCLKKTTNTIIHKHESMYTMNT